MLLGLQLYAFLRVLFKPSVTPPYLLILFYLVQGIAAIVDLVLSMLDEETSLGLVVLNLLRLAVPTLLTWIAGTLPLETVLPAQNVAKETDVSLSAVIACYGLRQLYKSLLDSVE